MSTGAVGRAAPDAVGLPEPRPGQPFLSLRRVVVAAVEQSCERHEQLDLMAHSVPLSEPDPRRVAAGFDYCVPMSPLGMRLGVDPTDLARTVADHAGRLRGVEVLADADAEGQYLNLRVNRERFVAQVAAAAVGGELGSCDHPPTLRTTFCIVSPDGQEGTEAFELVATLARHCSGSPADPLEEQHHEVTALLEALLDRGVGQSDPSGLTDAVLMGQPGERFLLRTPDGRPTVPVRVASRLTRSLGRPVLLALGAEAPEVVRRIDEVLDAVGSDGVEVRTFALEPRWSQLGALLRPEEREDSDHVIDLRDGAAAAVAGDAASFAVVRGLARLPDVSHRALETADPGYLLRFISHTQRRLEEARAAGAGGLEFLQSLLSRGLRLTPTAARPAGADVDESLPL